MIVGVPKEIKRDENRIAITPGGAAAFTGRGHTVLIERGAGIGSGFEDGEFRGAGAHIIPREEVFARAEMILKVKEPLPPEFDLLREGQILFTYLHLAPEPELTRALMRRRVAAIAYETVQLPDGSLPLLTPMSEVAGRMATQIGARLLEKPQGGRGVLLGGVPGVPPAEVVVVGGGIVGLNAARVAMGMGALVTILDISAERMRYIDDVYGGRMLTLMSNPFSLAATVRRADLLVGAVLIPGARAPRLVTADMVKTMKPGSVIVDVSIDQGGSIETIDRVTCHSDPTYVCHGVVHYSVPNIPGAVPRTSTFGLTNVTLLYALQLADQGLREALRANPALAKGVNVLEGQVTYEAVATATGVSYVPLATVLS